MPNLTAFLSYVFVTTFTPGPNNIMAMTNGNQFGFKKALNFILGVTTGFAIIMLLCNYLNLLLFNLMPKVGVLMKLLGSIYIIYLAVKILKSTSDENGSPSDNMSTFLTGITMQFVNPKVILYGITVTSNFIIPYYKSNITLFLFSIFLAFVGFLSTCCWALFGAVFQKFLSEYRKAFNILMALLLIYSAISILDIF
ncbi:LysE family transporter [Thermosediminibacter litoriperuensis]|uniref:Threonine/homoserine/homoserine lactone efflux protein n=1 Tax=Thermosediminibacter litoriperuensis TaxID=291989 RepID=A0A5S5AFX0_9FIRM|nr:LysE family transporter [Thermosediminibacter litoriperuensis]TYP47677.1 threonine/homoserine/homoserine lactone efflux protein [Thermosediminibacter litoriperuensis]